MRFRNHYFVNNSQYLWINLRDFEVETENKWLNIFNKHGNKSTLKYRRELTPNIKFQADRIFVRNDLFEQVIKSCKATNTEFLMFKEKLGICLYEGNYYEEEIIKIQDEEPIEEINKVSTKKSTKSLIDESDNESISESINESDNKSINESDKKPNKTSDNESNKESDNKNTTNWYDTNKFNKIPTNIDINKFNHKNKIDKLKFNDINALINNIKSNTISKANAKKKTNELNKIKEVETKGRRLIHSQKTLLSLFDDLKTIFNNNNNNSNSNNESDSNNKNENVNVNEDENKNENENESESKNESDDEQYYKIKQINSIFKKIDKTKSFEDQIY